MFRSRKSEPVEFVASSLSNGNASIIKREYTQEPIVDKQTDLTIESMSAVIAAAVQLSASGTPSSLSLGSASILSQESPKKSNKRFTLFSWKKQEENPLESNLSFSSDEDTSSPSSPSSPRSSSASCPKLADDGRDELQYRGIQIKEIKSTMKTLVISDNVRNPMPQVKLERPGFARINY